MAGGALYAQSGFVKSGNQPIPGATIAVTSLGQKLVTTTDQDGHYVLPETPARDCSIEVRMFGFDPVTKKTSCEGNEKYDFALQLQ